MLVFIDKNLIKNWNQDLNKLKRKIDDNCELEKDIKVEITTQALSKIGKPSLPRRNRKQTIVKSLSQESKQTIVYSHTDPLCLQLHLSRRPAWCADTSHVKVVQAVNPVGGLVSWFWPYPKNGHFPPSSRDIPRGISNHSMTRALLSRSTTTIDSPLVRTASQNMQSPRPRWQRMLHSGAGGQHFVKKCQRQALGYVMFTYCVQLRE